MNQLEDGDSESGLCKEMMNVLKNEVDREEDIYSKVVIGIANGGILSINANFILSNANYTNTHAHH